ncbi:MBG domain-containing protein, partial [Roseomonas genomospecies 6]
WKNGQGDSLLTGLTYATDATATSNVGSGYASTASGGTLGGAAAGNYTLSYAAGGFSVTPAALTVTPSGTMTYGATSPSFGFTASGWKNGQGDSLLTGVVISTDATATSNVGSYSTTASGGTLGGAAAGNYTLSYATGGFAVTPASLTVTPSGTMVYGSTSPSFGFTASGWKNGQSDANLSGLSYATDATATSNVGSYVTTASGGTLGGAAAGNYTLSYAAGGFAVTPAPLTVKATAAAKLYDGLAFSGGAGVTYDGFVNGETAAVLGGTPRFGGSAQGAVDVGRYVISVSGLTSGNYDIRYVDGELVVSQRMLTDSTDSAGRLPGKANPTQTTDRVDGGRDRAAVPASTAGTHAITSGSMTAGGNSDLRFLPGNFTVSPQPPGIAAILPMRLIDPAPLFRPTNMIGNGQSGLSNGGDQGAGGGITANDSRADNARRICATGEGCASLPHPANRSLGAYLTVKAQ